jgi:hypothetical protein
MWPASCKMQAGNTTFMIYGVTSFLSHGPVWCTPVVFLLIIKKTNWYVHIFKLNITFSPTVFTWLLYTFGKFCTYCLSCNSYFPENPVTIKITNDFINLSGFDGADHRCGLYVPEKVRVRQCYRASYVWTSGLQVFVNSDFYQGCKVCWSMVKEFNVSACCYINKNHNAWKGQWINWGLSTGNEELLNMLYLKKTGLLSAIYLTGHSISIIGLITIMCLRSWRHCYSFHRDRGNT